MANLFAEEIEQQAITRIQNEEIWKDIKGYKGRYQISSFGRVKSLFYHNAKGIKRDGILKPAKDAKGYLRCALSKKNVLTTFKIHRLVTEAFIPNRKKLPQVNHINGIKADNRVENLEWCDNSQNQIHAYKNGLNPIHRAHCTPIRVLDTETNNVVGYQTIKDFADSINYNPECIGNMFRRYKSKHVKVKNRYIITKI